MAGTFSGHLVDTFQKQRQGLSSSLVISGAMSFNPQMHGTPAFNRSMTDPSYSFSQPSFFNQDVSEETTLKIAALQAKLNQKLGPEYISQRPGPGGGPKLTYAEGWKIINLANEVFGFNGWSSSVVNMLTDFVDYNEQTQRYSVGVTAFVRVTLRDGVYHEDIGYGMLENSRSKGAALDKCKKEAVTDGLKRALRNFGNLLGNCLYDKTYTQEVVKIKVPPPKFDKSELYRRPEFEETKPNVASTSGTNNGASASVRDNFTTPARPPSGLSALPPHMRNETRQVGSFGGHAEVDVKANIHARDNKAAVNIQQQNAVTGLKTPIMTPMHQTTARPVVSDAASRPIVSFAPQPGNNQVQRTTAPSVNQRSILNNSNSSNTGAYTNKPTSTINTNNTARPNVVQPAGGPMKSKSTHTQPLKAEPTIEVKQLGPCDEDSFHFYSDDDAFLAQVDLGEGDLASLEAEADMGKPIDQGEGGDEDELWDQLNKAETRRETGRGGNPDQTCAGKTGQPSTSKQSQQQHTARQMTAMAAPSTTGESSNTRRTTTTTLGGFHFPDETKPVQTGRPNPSGSGLGHGSNAGTKRSSDAMLSHSTLSSSSIPNGSVSTSTANRRPGMGLSNPHQAQNQAHGHAQLRREPVVRHNAGDGEDAKRIRLR